MFRGRKYPGYPNKYFKIKNSGPSYARNYGAKQSKGKYLLFLDSDVLISTNMILKIIDFHLVIIFKK